MVVTATEVLSEARELGVQLFPYGEDIVWRWPKNAFDAKLYARIVENRKRLLVLLNASETMRPPRDAAQLDALVDKTFARLGIKRRWFDRFRPEAQEEIQALQDQLDARAVTGCFEEAALALLELDVAWREAADNCVPNVDDLGLDEFGLCDQCE